MGCGRVGASLAGQLADHGHSVAVIDQNAEAFRRLPADFDGRRVTGLGFDRDALGQAGIDEAYAFAAVSNGDNSNILAARVARETFGVANVVARIYDPRRAEVYTRLGIPTVGTVRWTADQILRHILPMGALTEYRDVTGHVSLVRVDLNEGWIGSPLSRLEEATDARVGYLTRLGRAVVAGPRLVVQENDVVHVLTPTDRVGAVQRLLADPPAEED
ncbi:TrkA family potassium uptake protein [Georgenia sp. 10Sc9-8]|uniref:TrkA family potassium uptake protein n=1 Tax=Georgenia halotolerans TaxID=3028317 RepID=A0ABT5U0E0_9MICO|nr:TrkA family potassium uptake protein [Georgenia halotolerans]